MVGLLKRDLNKGNNIDNYDFAECKIMTLLNAVYKILIKVLAKRLTFVEKLVDEPLASAIAKKNYPQFPSHVLHHIRSGLGTWYEWGHDQFGSVQSFSNT